MSYAFTNADEFDRLERQSKLPTYDYKAELDGLRVPEGAAILDAGCGSGIVSRHLATTFPQSTVAGCDASPLLVGLAAAVGEPIRNLRFDHCNLQTLIYDDQSFDLVVVRYVLEHLRAAELHPILAELIRVTKPNGSFLVIDGDGIILNLHPQTPLVEEGLAKFVAAKRIDLHMGRKIPFLLAEAGLKVVSWRVETVVFEGDKLTAEIQMMKDRFRNAAPFFEEVLGGRDRFQAFEAEYIACMRHPQAVSFYNKFIVNAFKTPV